MKRAIFAALLVAWSVPAAAADVCKGAKVKEDAFSSGSNVTMVIQKQSRFNPVGVTFELKSGEVLLHFVVRQSGSLDGAVPAGLQIPFAFGGGTVSALATAQQTSLKSYIEPGTTNVWTTVPYVIGVTREQLELMVNSELEAVRLTLPTGEFDWKPQKSFQKKLQPAAACMLQHLGA